MKVTFLGLFLYAACVTPVLSTDAKAGAITYSTAAAFDAATTDLTSYPIPAPASGTSEYITPSITIGPITFSSPGVYPNAGLFLQDDGAYGIGQDYLESYQTVETLTLAGATAIDFDLGTFGSAGSFSVSVNGGAPITVTTTASNPATQFFGITDASPITSLVLSIPSEHFEELDMVDFQTGSIATPELGSFALLSAGLLVLIASRRILPELISRRHATLNGDQCTQCAFGGRAAEPYTVLSTPRHGFSYR
jgi:hypothetical protein